ncbi:2'-5' RNA ligase family protein [Acidaminobacter sp. JC074]|uniref:2'-5' RNA ligase family protein n=1 Tax=Acidaminobacter sp. JC074 TaxID=2530199 RepID=UPI001F0D387E|nr:2'-5' RNA ligase family protein [Acidaminobacter sp. JC074]MCH4886273.1 2'-5' RNA ligase family protein [Acidaminobacter sp. JC074]
MYICIALLTDDLIQNKSRKIVFDLSQKYDIDTMSSRLPQHISLKQSFEIDKIDEIENYFDQLSKSMKPFSVVLNKIDLCLINNDSINKQILWYEIEESENLWTLHNKLNRELLDLFEIPMNGYDGDTFKFHSTIAYESNKEDLFVRYLENLKNRDESISFDVTKIALFYSPDKELRGDNFITYKIVSFN